MEPIAVDKRLIWPGFFISFAGAVALNSWGFLSVGLPLTVAGILVVILSIAKPFPETDGAELDAGRRGSLLAPANSILLAACFVILGLAALTSYLVPPFAFLSATTLSVSRALLLVWPWVLVTSLAWHPRRTKTNRPHSANW